MTKVCLFGAGRMAKSHAKTIHQCPDAELYCVVDPKFNLAQELANQYGAKAYQAHEDALNDKNIEAVVIVSSTDTHADLIIASANKGLPIFCEKPIDLDINRVNECLEVLKKTKVPFFLGFNRRFDPSFRTLREQINHGRVGSVELVSISSRDHNLPHVDFLKRSGGLFRDMMIHDFDMAQWLLDDEITEVYAAGSCKVDPSIAQFGDLDTAMVILKTKNGALCNINNSRRTAYGYDQRIEVFGNKGMLKAHNLTPTTVEFSDHEAVKTDKPYPGFIERYQIAYQNEIEHFFHDVIKNKQQPAISGEDGRKAILIANAAEKSYLTGLPVKL